MFIKMKTENGIVIHETNDVQFLGNGRDVEYTALHDNDVRRVGIYSIQEITSIRPESAPKSITHHNYQPGNGDSNYNGVDKNWADN
jgi:hypothetical protein